MDVHTLKSKLAQHAPITVLRSFTLDKPKTRCIVPDAAGEDTRLLLLREDLEGEEAAAEGAGMCVLVSSALTPSFETAAVLAGACGCGQAAAAAGGPRGRDGGRGRWAGVQVFGNQPTSLSGRRRFEARHRINPSSPRSLPSPPRRSRPPAALPPQLRSVISDLGLSWSTFDLEFDYGHLSTEQVLRQLLPAGVEVPSSFESIGHIAHLNLKEEVLPFKALIGQVGGERLK